MTDTKEKWPPFEPGETDIDKLIQGLSSGLAQMKKNAVVLKEELERMEKLKAEGEDVEVEIEYVRAGLKVAKDNIHRTLELLEEKELIKRKMSETKNDKLVN